MQTWNQRIAAAALLVLGSPSKYGARLEQNYCLNFARRVVEIGLSLANRGFYSLVTGESSNPSAAELERLFRAQYPKWLVSSRKKAAGDLLFWHDLPPKWGHVGVLVQRDGAWWVAQNTTVTKGGIDYAGALRLLPLSSMPAPSTIVRIGG